MQRTVYAVYTVGIAIMLTGTSRLSGAAFFGLGDLPGGDFSSRAGGVSADGSVVVGESASALFTEPFRWTRELGMVGLSRQLDLSPGLFFGTRGRSVSADGSVVVGVCQNYDGYSSFRWELTDPATGQGTAERIGPAGIQSTAYAVSADGSIVVGQQWSLLVAFRWTRELGMQELGQSSDGGKLRLVCANGVSADGSIVVGDGSTPSAQAFRWRLTNAPNPGDGVVEVLPDLPGGSSNCWARSISSDGTVVVGFGTSSSGLEACMWTSNGEVVPLGDLTGRAWAASSDGRVIVGEARGGAFIWDAEHGARLLREVLVNQCGLDLTGWTLGCAYDISDDGLTIVGSGSNPAGQPEAFVAVIPEPGTAITLGLGGLAIVGRRKRLGLQGE